MPVSAGSGGAAGFKHAPQQLWKSTDSGLTWDRNAVTADTQGWGMDFFGQTTCEPLSLRPA